MKKQLTLCIVHKPEGNNRDGNPQVLLGYKKRGFGAGRWNGFGGKVHENETTEQAALRELSEEAGITAHDMHKAGTLEFFFRESGDELEVHVFRASLFSGDPAESEEMRPKWFYIDEIPFADMWPDDRYWFPLFLRGTLFFGRFEFDASEHIVKMHVEPVQA